MPDVDGFSYGSGNGSGKGSGTGYGSGKGSGTGYGSGSGTGTGYGSGSGYGSGYVTGFSYGYGSGEWEGHSHTKWEDVKLVTDHERLMRLLVDAYLPCMVVEGFTDDRGDPTGPDPRCANCANCQLDDLRNG
jgi:hypothetical protein